MRRALLAFTIILTCYLALVSSNAMALEKIKLEAKSDHEAFKVEIMWTPNDIGSQSIFEIHFIDPETSIEIEDVRYDILIYVEGNKLLLHKTDQVAIRQRFSFDKPGSYTIRINNIEDLDENAIIPIQVTPEFPALGLSLIAPLSIGTLLLLLTRRNSNYLFRYRRN